MRLNFGAARHPGWMAVCLAGKRVDLVHVDAGGARPAVRLAVSFERGGDDADTLARLRRAHGLGRYRCATLMDAATYHIVQLDAPNVPEDELAEALRWRLKDMVDIAPADMSVDALLLPASGARAAQALAVAAARAAVDARAAPFERARLPLQAIDVPELAQRSLAALYEPEGRGLALLAVGETDTLLTLTCAGELYAWRRIEVGAAQLATEDAQQRQALGERIGLELQRSLDTFDRQFSFIALGGVLAALPAGAEWLLEALGAASFVPVTRLDLAERIDLEPVPALRAPGAQARYLPAIGLALRATEPA